MCERSDIKQKACYVKKNSLLVEKDSKRLFTIGETKEYQLLKLFLNQEIYEIKLNVNA